jgi:hypothetical protein
MRRPGYLALLLVVAFAFLAASSPATHTHLAGNAPAHCAACVGSPTVAQVPAVFALASALPLDALTLSLTQASPHSLACPLRVPGRAPPSLG